MPYDCPTPPPFVYFAGIVKIPEKTEVHSYHELICSIQDQKIVHEIVSILADQDKFNILLQSSYIKSLGAQINHLHPLKFLSTIFTHSESRKKMKPLFNDYFKRQGFLEGLISSMEREILKGKLFIFLGDFAEEMGLPLSPIEELCQKKEWEKLVFYLIETKSE